MLDKRSCREKLSDAKDLPRVQQLTGGMRRRYGPGTIVLPAPGEVDALMRKGPRGKVTPINQIRECLAKRRLEQEDLEVVGHGERLFVMNHEKSLAELQ
jgi:hypothetical protein